MLNFLKKVHREVINKWGFINNFYFSNLKKLVHKKIIFKGNSIQFRQKTYFTGKGLSEIGFNCHFGYKLGGFFRGGSIEIQPRYANAKIKIGNNVLTNNNIFLCAANYIEIGNNTLIGQNVTMIDHEAHDINPLKRKQLGEIGEIIIGNNVWIGNNVTILKNSKIGDNTIIATGAVVSGKFDANLIIGGIPAKIIKEINV